MDGIAQSSSRDGRGRFLPGRSGNPAGKRPGTRNRATILATALGEGEGEAAARVVIDKALAGDVVAARFVVDRLSPKPRGRAIVLDLPEGESAAGDAVAMFNSALRALAAGQITPDEAVAVARFLEGRCRVLRAWQIERKVTRYGRETVPGDDRLPDDAAEGDEIETAAPSDADGSAPPLVEPAPVPPPPAGLPQNPSPACGPPAGDRIAKSAPISATPPQAGEEETGADDEDSVAAMGSPLHFACISTELARRGDPIVSPPAMSCPDEGAPIDKVRGIAEHSAPSQREKPLVPAIAVMRAHHVQRKPAGIRT